MKSYSAFFVRGDDIAGARQVFGRAEPIAGTPWLLCAYQRDDGPPDDDVLLGQASLTQEKSQQLGEVFFVFGDTSINGFAYEHARDGLLLRKLVWFPLLDDDWAEGWLCAEGEPEAWEQRLFNADALARLLEGERQRYEDHGKADQIATRVAEIQEVWEAGRIVAGHTFPECDGTAALLVEHSHGISRPELTGGHAV